MHTEYQYTALPSPFYIQYWLLFITLSTWYQTLRKQREASVRTQNNTRIYPVSKMENVDDFNPSVINVQLVSNQKVEEQCDVILLLDLCLTIFSLNLRNTTGELRL